VIELFVAPHWQIMNHFL